MFCAVVGPIELTHFAKVPMDFSDVVNVVSSLSSALRRFMSVWPVILLPVGLERFKSAQTSTTNYGYF